MKYVKLFEEANARVMSLVAIAVEASAGLKIMHWQTRKFTQHDAFGKAYDDLALIFDKLVEMYFGKFGRQENDSFAFTIDIKDPVVFVEKIISMIVEWSNSLDDADEIENVAEEAIGRLRQLQYLLTMDAE